MELTQSDLKKLQEIATKHPQVGLLLEFYASIRSNAAYDTYVSRMTTLQRWNDELMKSKVGLVNSGKDAEVHDKAVDRLLKFVEMQPKFLEGTKQIVEMLLPEEKAKADEKLKHGTDMAF